MTDLEFPNTVSGMLCECVMWSKRFIKQERSNAVETTDRPTKRCHTAICRIWDI